MTQETKKRIHLIYGIVLSIVTVFAGICFIAACLNIYYSGIASDLAQIYTRQIVAENFSKISLPVYACLVLVMGGMMLDLALPIEKPKRKPEKNLPLILSRLCEKADLDACDEGLRKAVHTERQHQKTLFICNIILTVCGWMLLCNYASDPSHWGSNSTPSMISATYVALPCLLIPFAFSVFAVYKHRASVARQIELMRQATAQAPKAAEKAEPKQHSQMPVQITRIAILAAGVVLVVLGACNEGTVDILNKAVAICTECVGLG